MGTIKKFTFEKNVVCESCKGDGIEPKSTPRECEECGGSGEVGKSLNMYTGKCKACQGIGLVTQPCTNCSGVGYGSRQVVE